jgi:hypothetical protein
MQQILPLQLSYELFWVSEPSELLPVTRPLVSVRKRANLFEYLIDVCPNLGQFAPDLLGVAVRVFTRSSNFSVAGAADLK